MTEHIDNAEIITGYCLMGVGLLIILGSVGYLIGNTGVVSEALRCLGAVSAWSLI